MKMTLSCKKKLKSPIRLYKNYLKYYFYEIKYTKNEIDLCRMEMKCLFNKTSKIQSFFSYHHIEPSRSPFVKFCISIRYCKNSLKELLDAITKDNYAEQDFKVKYINYGNNILSFHERRKIESTVGLNIKGEANLFDPKITLGITEVNNKWILGEFTDNRALWQIHNHKPYNYCNALDVKLARSLVNISVCNNKNIKLVDPCCGIGTVVMEAISLDHSIEGYELNPLIAENAQINLNFFGYANVITCGNMHDITKSYDISIVDTPYGLFSLTTPKEQQDIINTCRRISKKMVIVTFENLDDMIIAGGFRIVDRCYMAKGTFIRYITICE